MRRIEVSSYSVDARVKAAGSPGRGSNVIGQSPLWNRLPEQVSVCPPYICGVFLRCFVFICFHMLLPLDDRADVVRFRGAGNDDAAPRVNLAGSDSLQVVAPLSIQSMASVTAQQGPVVETRFTTSITASTSFVLLSHGGATFIQGIQSTGRVFCWNSLISNDHYTGLQGGFAHIYPSYHTEYDRYIATLVHVPITLRALLAFWVRGMWYTPGDSVQRQSNAGKSSMDTLPWAWRPCCHFISILVSNQLTWMTRPIRHEQSLVYQDYSHHDEA